MAKGYFAGQLTMLYRETSDGRRVTGWRWTRFNRQRWYLVSPEDQAAFERRAVVAHVVGMALVVVGAQFIGESVLLGILSLAAIVGLVVAPISRLWMVTGLPRAEIKEAALQPLSRAEASLRHARAMGTRTVTVFVVLSVVLTIPQAIVAVTDGVWWSWLGLVGFGACGVYFARMLMRLRAEGEQSRAT